MEKIYRGPCVEVLISKTNKCLLETLSNKSIILIGVILQISSSSFSSFFFLLK